MIPPKKRLSFLRIARNVNSQCCNPSLTNAASVLKLGATWNEYCDNVGIPSHCTDIGDPLPFLQVFAHHYRTGKITPSNQPVLSRTVEGALLGPPDPRLNSTSQPHYTLQQQHRGYNRLDTPASRVKPIPLPIVQHLYTTATSDLTYAIADIRNHWVFLFATTWQTYCRIPGIRYTTIYLTRCFVPRRRFSFTSLHDEPRNNSICNVCHSTVYQTKERSRK